jgi:uncharacterized membrane protein YeaQ/YmgE (transglycosylase-associated protein family)
MEIIGVIIAGLIIGLLGKLIAPGDKDNIPIWLTLLCGVGGVVLGWYILADASTVLRWIVSIVIAAVLVVIASTVTGRNTSKARI